MPITDAMRRDKAIFFSKISLICITIGITIFINRYISDRCFHSCVILRGRGRGGVCSSIFNFRFLSCCPNVSPLSPNLSTLLVGRDLSFPGIFEIHKVISSKKYRDTLLPSSKVKDISRNNVPWLE